MKDEPVVDNSGCKFNVTRARAMSKNANSPLIRMNNRTTVVVPKADIVRVKTAEKAVELAHAPKVGDGLAAGVVQVKSQMKP